MMPPPRRPRWRCCVGPPRRPQNEGRQLPHPRPWKTRAEMQSKARWWRRTMCRRARRSSPRCPSQRCRPALSSPPSSRSSAPSATGQRGHWRSPLLWRPAASAAPSCWKSCGALAGTQLLCCSGSTRPPRFPLCQTLPAARLKGSLSWRAPPTVMTQRRGASAPSGACTYGSSTRHVPAIGMQLHGMHCRSMRPEAGMRACCLWQRKSSHAQWFPWSRSMPTP
mmetsp:Transcript_107825/g.300625  ORF Transcript_107825/g.300625 Transcript_107825/m.300625 type:complete len:223 (-) Transcript_107825:1742-2410(-)